MSCNYERLSAQFVLKSVPFPQLVSLVLCLQIIITQSNEEMVPALIGIYSIKIVQLQAM